MSSSTGTEAHAAPISSDQPSAPHEKTAQNPDSPKSTEKTAPRRKMASYEYKLALPYYCDHESHEIIKLAYTDLPSNDPDLAGICHNLILRKACGFYVPCTFKSRDGEYSWPDVRNKAQAGSALLPAKPLDSPAACPDCTSNELPNRKVDLSISNTCGPVPQTKLDEKHTIVLLFHTANRLYPFCMEFTYSPSVFVQISVDGKKYKCCGEAASTRVQPEQRAHALSISVCYHNKTYVVEHPNFQFGNHTSLTIGSTIYTIDLSDANMRTLPSADRHEGACYFKTTRESNGRLGYFFLTKGSDRELLRSANPTEPVFYQEEWSTSDTFKAQVTSLSWVANKIHFDYQREFLRFGVSGTAVIRSEEVHKTHRLFKPFLMSNEKVFILEKLVRLDILCTSL